MIPGFCFATGPNLLKFGDFHPDATVDVFSAPETPDAPVNQGHIFWLLEALSGILEKAEQSRLASAETWRKEAMNAAVGYREMEITRLRALTLHQAWVNWFNTDGAKYLPPDA